MLRRVVNVVLSPLVLVALVSGPAAGQGSDPSSHLWGVVAEEPAPQNPPLFAQEQAFARLFGRQGLRSIAGLATDSTGSIKVTPGPAVLSVALTELALRLMARGASESPAFEPSRPPLGLALLVGLPHGQIGAVVRWRFPGV